MATIAPDFRFSYKLSDLAELDQYDRTIWDNVWCASKCLARCLPQVASIALSGLVRLADLQD